MDRQNSDAITQVNEMMRPNRSCKAVVLINGDAGAMLELDRLAVAQRIIDSFASCGYLASPRFVPGAELASAFRAAHEAHEGLIVVAGGDGSVNAVLPEAIRTGAVFATLPLGTLNLLGQDLGMTGDLDADAAAIAGGTDVACDVIAVNDRIFHSSAGLGYFVTMAAERQAARQRFPFSKKLGFAFAVARTLWFTGGIGIEYTADGVARTTVSDAVLVTNNRFFGTPWRRERLDAGVLELHLFNAPDLPQRLKVILAILRGTWRDLDSLTTIDADKVTIRRRSRRRSMRVALDGELVRLDNPLQFEVKPAAVRLRAANKKSANV
ncbi:MAG: diacylglycerol/lipid kinase family protein [Beijerinckiaceae bacterium]